MDGGFRTGFESLEVQVLLSLALGDGCQRPWQKRKRRPLDVEVTRTLAISMPKKKPQGLIDCQKKAHVVYPERTGGSGKGETHLDRAFEYLKPPCNPSIPPS